MSSKINFNQTYLYKIRTLANILDKVFDRKLRKHADITLSQFMVLLAISYREGSNQRQVAKHLGLSPAAVKRQVDIARHAGWLRVAGSGRNDCLYLTAVAEKVIEVGLQVLEQHVFQIFAGHNRSANLMQHINLLLDGAEEALESENLADVPRLSA